MGRRVPTRRRQQNRFSMILVFAVVIMLSVVVFFRGRILQQELNQRELKVEELEHKISQEDKRAQEITEYEKYTQTKKYAEEVAKDKLGLVYEDEIIFQEGN